MIRFEKREGLFQGAVGKELKGEAFQVGKVEKEKSGVLSVEQLLSN